MKKLGIRAKINIMLILGIMIAGTILWKSNIQEGTKNFELEKSSLKVSEDVSALFSNHATGTRYTASGHQGSYTTPTGLVDPNGNRIRCWSTGLLCRTWN